LSSVCATGVSAFSIYPNPREINTLNDLYGGKELIIETIYKQHLANIEWVMTQPHLLEVSSSNHILGDSCHSNPLERFIPDATWQRRWHEDTTALRQSLSSVGNNAKAINSTMLTESGSALNFPKLLGHCYESYWHRIITQLPEWSLVINNMQIIENKQTLGELDAIVFDHIERLHEHWEFSCKFYMLIGDDEANPSHWVGPNHTDSLGRKLKRLFQHQFPLINQPIVKTLLAERQIDQVKQRMMLHGRLFTPFQQQLPDDVTIDLNGLAGLSGLSSSRIATTEKLSAKVLANNIGQWCLIEELMSIENTLNGDDWVMLDKLYWMNYLALDDDSKRIKTQALQSVIAELDRPIMVRHCSSGRCLFVLSNSWLQSAQESVKLLKQ
jgi:hypothetical protein